MNLRSKSCRLRILGGFFGALAFAIFFQDIETSNPSTIVLFASICGFCWLVSTIIDNHKKEQPNRERRIF